MLVCLLRFAEWDIESLDFTSQSDIWNQARIVELVLATLAIPRVIHKYVLMESFRPFKIAWGVLR